ncbi:GNAT family N-acetyltransferase [Niveibacterium sp. 24ML]|uniref:GNAT family N-acetyltransferase n=1 Tax=Niveibacterium sp. 24ML TaxID=2985512 RepID=UPI00226DAED0|nr:GNAT family N-acetyltransferase [Niveibacterium sp. 24ML]MCX9158051.1 GNAT family N-acetyltransferase [Niveibacterium sp. 24ML]
MHIRFAHPDDADAFVELGRRYHQITRFSAFDYNAEKVRRSLTELIAHKGGKYCFFVAEDAQGTPVGGLIGCIESHVFSDQLVASVIHYDVLPERRMSGAAVRLLTAFRKWAENRGAVELCAGVNSGVQTARTDRFLRKLGFSPTGGNYVLRLATGGATPFGQSTLAACPKSTQ